MISGCCSGGLGRVTLCHRCLRARIRARRNALVRAGVALFFLVVGVVRAMPLGASGIDVVAGVFACRTGAADFTLTVGAFGRLRFISLIRARQPCPVDRGVFTAVPWRLQGVFDPTPPAISCWRWANVPHVLVLMDSADRADHVDHAFCTIRTIRMMRFTQPAVLAAAPATSRVLALVRPWPPAQVLAPVPLLERLPSPPSPPARHTCDHARCHIHER